MRIFLILVCIQLFPYLLIGQDTLKLKKSITWQGFDMRGAKASMDDSSVFKWTGKSILLENLHSGKSSELVRSDLNIVNFDVEESKKQICYINEKSEIVLFDYNNNEIIGRKHFYSESDLYQPVFSPGGRKILLSRHKSYRLEPTDTYVRNRKRGPDSIYIFSSNFSAIDTLKFDGEVINADFINEETLVFTLSQADRIRVFSYDFSGYLEELAESGSISPYFQINHKDQALVILYPENLKVVKRAGKQWHVLSLARMPPGYTRGDWLIEFDDTSGQYLLLRDDYLELRSYYSTNAQKAYSFSHNSILSPYGYNAGIRKVGNHLVYHFDDGRINLYQMPNLPQVKRKTSADLSILMQRLGNGRIIDMSYSPGNMMLAFRDEKWNINIYDLNARKKIYEMKSSNGSYRYAFHPTDSTILYINNPSLLVKNYKTGITRELRTGYITDFDISPDGQHIAFAPFFDSSIYIVEYGNARLREKYKLPLQPLEQISKIYFNPTGHGIIVTSSLCIYSSPIPLKSKYEYGLYYCERESRICRKLGKVDSHPAVNFSPNGQYISVTNYTNNLWVHDLIRSDSLPLVVKVPGCAETGRQDTDSPREKFENPGYSFFFNDSIVGITNYQREICRYNVYKKEFITPLIGDERKQVEAIYSPPSGKYYFQLNFTAGIDLKTKHDNNVVFSIENSYTDFKHLDFLRDNKLWLVNSKYCRLFNIPGMSIDSTYDIQLFSLQPKINLDTSTGWIVYADYRDIKATALRKTDFSYGKNFEIPYQGRSVEAIAPDFEKGMLGVVYRPVASDTFDLTVLDVRDYTNPQVIFQNIFPGAEFQSLAYNSEHSVYFLLYKSVADGEFHLYKFIQNRITHRFEYIKQVLNAYTEAPIMYADLKRNTLYLFANRSGRYSLVLIDATTLKEKRLIIFTSMAKSIAVDDVNSKILIGDEQGFIHVYDIFLQTATAVQAHEGGVLSLSLSKDGKLVSIGSEGTIKYWYAKNVSLIGSLYFIGQSDFVFIDKDGYYMSTKNGVKGIAFQLGDKVIPVEQLDMQLNRPDIILKTLDSSANAQAIKLYEMALKKRAVIGTVSSVQNFIRADRPKIDVKNSAEILFNTDTSKFNLRFEASDAQSNLQYVQVWINNVPVYRGAGNNLRSLATRKKMFNIPVVLNEGQNKIEFSVTNARNIESIRMLKWITYTPSRQKHYTPKTYLFNIAVNNYEKPGNDLKYAVNDGRTLMNYFKQHTLPNEFQTDSFYNKRATKKALEVIRSKLINTKVDDKVIIFLSGHGTVDTANFEFYFGSYDIDFDNPAQHGISYREIESVLKNIPARRKLILIDACHSGLYDKGVKSLVNRKSDTVQINGTNVIIRNAGRGAKSASELDRKSFELMQEVFWNTEKSDGSFVIAASSGDSYAIESASLNNGVFTFALLDVLNNQNGDKMSIKQLAETISKKVMEITRGKQKPELRKEYIDSDWNLFE